MNLYRITEGTSEIHFDTSHKVERVLEYYVGGEGDQKPFGGRDKQTEALNRWLIDPKDEGNKALVAIAGRGKSALLANWAVRIAKEREDIHVVYFPITARYNTNLESVVFSALAGRIARLYEEEIRTVKALDAQQARALFVTYLDREPPDGKKILVVLDGLDEAAGWEISADIFPAKPPEYLSVLVAARPLAGDRDRIAWLRRLGWESLGKDSIMDLDLLDEEGVKDVLHKMGDPLARLSTNLDIAAKLHELSKGDPYLLRLYVETLLEEREEIASLTIEKLGNLKPGLENYIENWFEDQCKIWAKQYKEKSNPDTVVENDRRVRDFFNILAFAKGPLKREDVFQIGNGLFKDEHEIEVISQYTKRFVIGDGIENGYVFNHSKMGYFFEEQISDRKKKEYRQLFVNYGDLIFMQLEEGIIEPKEAPTYIIRNHSVHLEETGADNQKFYDLMYSEKWLRAWEWLEGTPTGFLSDVRKAWDKAIEEGLDGLGKQVFASLCYSSVHSITSNIPLSVFSKCVQTKLISQQLGLVFVKFDSDEKRKAQKIISLFQNLESRYFSDVLCTISSIKDDFIRVSTQIEVSEYLPEYEREELLKNCLDTLVIIRNQWNISNLILRISTKISSNELILKLIELAESIINVDEKIRVFFKLTKNLSKTFYKDLLEKLIQYIEEIDVDENRIPLLVDFIKQFPEFRNSELIDSLQEQIDLLGTKGEKRVEILLYASKALTSNKLKKVLGKAKEEIIENFNRIYSIKDEVEQTKTLINSGWMMAPKEIQESTVELIKRIEDYEIQFKIIKTLPLYAYSKNLQRDLIQLVESKNERLSQVRLLISMALRVSPEQNKEILYKALKKTRFIKDDFTYALAIKEFARESISDNVRTEAFSLTGDIKNIWKRAEVQLSFVPFLPNMQKSKIITEIIELFACKNSNTKEISTQINEYSFSEKQKKELKDINKRSHFSFDSRKGRIEASIDNALEVHKIIIEDWSRDDVYNAIINYLTGDELRRFLISEINKSNQIADEEIRAKIVINLLIYLPDNCSGQAINSLSIILKNALNNISLINEESTRHIKMIGIAPLLFSEELHDTYLEMVKSIETQWRRAQVLKAIGPNIFSSRIQKKYMTFIESIDSKWRRAKALLAIIPRLSNGCKENVIDEVFKYSNLTDSIDLHIEINKELIPYLTNHERLKKIDETLELIGEIPQKSECLLEKIEILEYLSKSRRKRISNEIFEQIISESKYVYLLQKFPINYLSEDMIHKIINSFNSYPHTYRWNIPINIINRLPENQKDKMLNMVLEMGWGFLSSESWGLEKLKELIQRFDSATLLVKAWKLSEEIVDKDLRINLQLYIINAKYQTNTISKNDYDFFNRNYCNYSYLHKDFLFPLWKEMCIRMDLNSYVEIKRILNYCSELDRPKSLEILLNLIPLINEIGGSSKLVELSRIIVNSSMFWN